MHQVIFRAKFGAPPNHFELLRPWPCAIQTDATQSHRRRERWGGAQCRRYGGQGSARYNGCLCSPSFRFTKNTVLGTSRNCKATDNDGKRE